MQAPPPISPLSPPPKPNFASRHWKLTVVLACLAGLLFLAGIFGLVVLLMKGMKSSSVYSGAMAKAESSPTAIAALGTPMKDGFFFIGGINEETTESSTETNSSGNAEFVVPVSGPKGSGHLSFHATRGQGEWHYDDLTLLVDKTNERLDLLNTNQ